MKRSKHSLSHTRLTSLKMGQIYPVACVEVLPGDSFRHQTACLVRVAPLVAPVMHPVHLMVHHWYVPSRLLWDSWEDFITGKNPALVVPTVTLSAHAQSRAMAQAFGVGADTGNVVLNALPFRAYNQIYNEFYRDQDLSALAGAPTGNGPDAPENYAIQPVSWEKDYFTTCRPQPQQGAGTESIAVNIAGELPIKGIGRPAAGTYVADGQTARESDGTSRVYASAEWMATNSPSGTLIEENPGNPGYPYVRATGTGLTASMDINAWRTSMAMQRMREHRNRYGSRYRDLLAFLGVNSSDARLQRPEYLGGGKQTISFSEVLSTADTGITGAPIGEMAGHGIAAMRTRPYKRFFEEHGYMLSFLIARPRTVYPTRS